MKWSLYQIWNQSLEQREERILKARDNIWAGELGGSFIDRWLKMKAVPYTNPPNPRSLRKFEAGNIWEWIVSIVLKRAGILQTHNEWCSMQYPDCLKVTGKLDFLAGGKPDWDKAYYAIQKFGFPIFITKATGNIIEHFKTQFPEGIETIILELKSCSSFMFELYEKNNTGSQNHKLQLFHYLKAKQIPEGHIVYISKDDARMLEIGIWNPSDIENEYRRDINSMTYFINEDEQPPLENPIIWDTDFNKFSTNYKVGYSVYLTKLYGLKDQLEFDTKYKPIVERWNRVIGRIASGKTMTKNNQEVKDEILKEFPAFDFNDITIIDKLEI